MNYRGTIAYRTNLGGKVDEGFLHSVVMAWDFLLKRSVEGSIREGRECLAEPDYSFHFMRGLSCEPAESANQIAETFLGDWVLMLDTDHVFGSDAFYEMIMTFEENHLDVLVGFTQKRVYPYHPVIYKTKFDPLVDFETIFPNPLERQRLIPIDSSGAACLMVSRKMFSAIKERFREKPFDRRPKFTFGWPVPKDRLNTETFGEDTSFFWRVHMLGIQAFCAPWVKFHHLAMVLVDETMIAKALAPQIPE